MGTATESNVKRWFQEGKKMGAVQMVVVSDMSLFEDSPRYIMKGEKPLDKIMAWQKKKFKVGPIYNLGEDFEPQLANNFPKIKKKKVSDDFF